MSSELLTSHRSYLMSGASFFIIIFPLLRYHSVNALARSLPTSDTRTARRGNVHIAGLRLMLQS